MTGRAPESMLVAIVVGVLALAGAVAVLVAVTW